MFKSLSNNSSIPNSYVYTSHKGTEYMYLDGSWINCETMNEVANIHNFKMNQSAIKQISEHNEKSTLKIGKTYSINESTVVYVGRDKFTKNGNLLHESINVKVRKLMEAENPFSNFVRGDTKPLEIPHGFQVGDYHYNKSKNKWYNRGEVVDEPQFNRELNTEAIKEIEKYNQEDDFPVNSTIDYQGSTLTWNGINWISTDGKRYGDKFGKKVHDFLEENPEQNKKPADAEPDATPPENADPATEEPTDDTSGSADSSSAIPNGYVYTSGKGKTYMNRNGTWYDTSTKKPINSSAAQSLERAAKAAIDRHNQTEKVKIGQQWTSRKGNVFTYVGNNRFISKDGKLLPAGTATQALQQLESGSTDSADPAPAPTPDTQDSGQDQNPAPTGDPAPEPTSDPAPSSDDSTGDSGNGQDPLQGLADQIKSSPSAPKIIVLLSRGDAVSLLAADILLAGEKSEAVSILQSLNSRD